VRRAVIAASYPQPVRIAGVIIDDAIVSWKNSPASELHARSLKQNMLINKPRDYFHRVNARAVDSVRS